MAGDHIFHYLCIGCPLGCRLEVEENPAGTDVEVRGWGCKTGKIYGRQEHTNPRRVVATSVGIRGGRCSRLPVKTSGPVPKAMVRAVARALRRVEVEAPVWHGTVVVADVLGTGVDIVATRDVEEANDATVEGALRLLATSWQPTTWTGSGGRDGAAPDAAHATPPAASRSRR
jgi:CxxC motif-containing protein